MRRTMEIKIDCIHCGCQMETVFEDKITLSGMAGNETAIFRKTTLYFCEVCQKHYHIISEPFKSERLK